MIELITVDTSHILALSELIKDKANSMFDECAPFSETPVDSEDYIWLMGIASAIAYQVDCIQHNLKFKQEQGKTNEQQKNK